jgi:PleD family two-component response regulator
MGDEQAKATILVVDDTPENIDVLNGILKPDYKIKVALNGEKALKVATSDKKPDLILLDIMMPGMDGFEVCRRLKGDADTSHIPVIFVSGAEDAASKDEGLKLGAVDYIVKPIDPNIVKDKIAQHLI